MILQSLCDYYDRQQDILPVFGFEQKPIPFTVVIDLQGKFVELQDNSVVEDGKSTVINFRVPKATGRSGAKSYETANCLWDHYGYIANQAKVDKPGKPPSAKNIEMAQKQHDSFKATIAQIAAALPNDSGVNAVQRFLQNPSEVERLKAAERWQECLKVNGCNLTFRLAGEKHLVCQSTAVIDWVKQQPMAANDVQEGICLITGEKTQVVRLHSGISGVNQKPAPLAAINEPAYNSYGKDKGFNFPVSVAAAFKYSTALNHLLRKSSTTKFRIGDTSYVCWADKANMLETTIPFLLADAGDDPDKGTQVIKSLFDTIHNGAFMAKEGRDRFYVLALAPNSARIMVRLWQVGTVGEFAVNLTHWFKDLEIIGVDHHGFPPLKKLLRATALLFKDDNVPPNLPADVVRSILLNLPLPATFMQAAIRRIKAEQGNVTYHRACIVKAYLNRQYRSANNAESKELTMSLDVEDKRVGYCLGRLFALLEKLQSDAMPGINATIRDRYYSSASCTPKAVFGTLIRMSTHHLNKLEKVAWRVSADNRIAAVVDLIREFPAQLSLADQGLFAIGYYHQKQDLYTKKADKGE